MKSGETADRRDEVLGQALREAAGLAATSGEVDFEAVYAAAERRGPVRRRGSAIASSDSSVARSGSGGRSGSPTPIHFAGRRLALALPLAAAAGLAIVAGLGEAERSRGFRDEIALLSRRVVGPGLAGAAGTPTELSLFVEGLWREGEAAWGAYGEADDEGDGAAGDSGEGAGAAAPSF